MKENFQLSLKRVLVHEGGKVDHPKDPGGRTNQGVTQRTYNAYRTGQSLPRRDVFLMADQERDAIYKLQYWDAIQGDKLPVGVDYVLFDGAVNSGAGQSIKWLQRALGVKADGVIGQMTLAAVDAHPDYDRLIGDIIERRFTFLAALKTWNTFGKGWTSRLRSVQAHGQAQASGAVGAPPVFVPNGNAKAPIEDAKKVPGTGLSDTGAGTAAGLAAGITWLKTQLEPYADTLPHLDTIVAVIAVTGILATGAGTIYSVWARKRAAALADALDTGVPAT